MSMEDPKKLYSVVRDHDGELWMRGRKWWYCQSSPGKLMWYDLERTYGPLGVDQETERIQALGREGGRARD